jgi:hypothetical protein
MNKRIGLIAVLALGVLLVAPAPAESKRLDSVSFHEPYDLVHKDFCGAPGVTVSDKGTSDVRLFANTRGSQAGFAYVNAHVLEHGTVTDLRSGIAVTYTLRVHANDLRITDNGDGTINILNFATGPFTAYGPDGKAISRNPGQHREVVRIDYNGTPGNIDDDKFVDVVEVLKESTGRNDDFCAAVLEVFGVELP